MSMLSVAPDRRHALLVSAALALVVLASSACSPRGDGQVEARARALRIVGSSTVAPLAAELARRFEAAHPGCRIDVEMGGSTRGIVDVRSGAADIGMVSRALRADEGDLRSYLCAKDGVALIVHEGVGVEELRHQDVLAVFEGRTTNWQSLGGHDQVITVVHKAEGRSTLEVFLEHFGLAPEQVRASVVIGDNQQGIKTVSSIPGAIGYVSIGAAETAVAEGAAIRILPLGAVAATTEHVRDGTFPLARELNFVTKQAVKGLAKDFIDYAQSAAADDVVRAFNFVAVRR